MKVVSHHFCEDRLECTQNPLDSCYFKIVHESSVKKLLILKKSLSKTVNGIFEEYLL